MATEVRDPSLVALIREYEAAGVAETIAEEAASAAEKRLLAAAAALGRRIENDEGTPYRYQGRLYEGYRNTDGKLDVQHHDPIEIVD
jgi:hypothetical protein